mmetsp:Transcript_122494/g.341743  ORF Transcript_122494/g.341743 Transcript_122494/m.341743 type:complete len:110 (+) Transcript_122494:165-494(+)
MAMAMAMAAGKRAGGARCSMLPVMLPMLRLQVLCSRVLCCLPEPSRRGPACVTSRCGSWQHTGSKRLAALLRFGAGECASSSASPSEHADHADHALQVVFYPCPTRSWN